MRRNIASIKGRLGQQLEFCQELVAVGEAVVVAVKFHFERFERRL